MHKLTPTTQATLDAFDAGPGNVHELRERTGRSRSATDKAISDLAKKGLITKVDNGGDPADGTPTRWQLADPPTETGPDSAEPATDTEGTAANTEELVADTDAGTGPEGEAEPEAEAFVDETVADDSSGALLAEGFGAASEIGMPAADAGDPMGNQDNDGADNLGGPSADDAVSDAAEAAGHQQQTAQTAEQPKICKGCQALIPKVCPTCWQKTPGYCGQCRQDKPHARRGDPGEPQILSNGLPRLRPGELEQMVLQVMRDNELPHHVGVTGWTGGRVAIYLPGRSTGAINNALEKLTRSGTAELIGDAPMRYRLAAPNQPEVASEHADTSERPPDDGGSTGETPDPSGSAEEATPE